MYFWRRRISGATLSSWRRAGLTAPLQRRQPASGVTDRTEVWKLTRSLSASHVHQGVEETAGPVSIGRHEDVVAPSIASTTSRYNSRRVIANRD